MSDQAQRIDLFARTFRDIGIIQERMDAIARNRLPESLPLAQYKLLDHLVYTANLDETSADIARNSHVSKAAMSQIIKRLLDKNYVELRPGEKDRRVKTLLITATGRDIHQQAQATILPALKTFSQQIPLTSLQTMQSAINEFRTSFEQHTSV